MSAIVSHNLSPLTSLDQKTVLSISDQAVEFIVRGFKFSPEEDDDCGVERGSDAVTALAKIFSESGRRSHNQQMILRQLSPYNFLSEETKSTLTGCYMKNMERIRDNTPSRQTLSREYTVVSWRLDVEIGRRAVQKINKPLYVGRAREATSRSNTP